ncbi:MAG: YHS domain-containing (seleno)protein [Xanthomonadaceae bacterium]|nr:YHS domain-containing (seleno)protein [Xanthomonadaceae bacterium]
MRIAMKAVVLVLGLMMSAPGPLFAQGFKAPEVPPDVAIGGYSPVSYFERDRAERGSPEFAAEHEGRTYWLVSAEQKARFEADPRAFEPAFNAFCPFSLALGRKVAIDPTRFKIVEGKLLLFHNSGELDALEEWNLKGDEHWLDRKPDGEFTLKRF